MDRLIANKNVRQFISYFGVGGAAALVEWFIFFLLEYFFDMQYLAATAIAFIFSTTTNWILGRMFTFRDSGFHGRRVTELALVFVVSAIGLGLNLLLMLLFVNVFRMNTNLMKTAAKILATGLVFIWNFLARKLFIYRHE